MKKLGTGLLPSAAQTIIDLAKLLVFYLASELLNAPNRFAMAKALSRRKSRTIVIQTKDLHRWASIIIVVQTVVSALAICHYFCLGRFLAMMQPMKALKSSPCICVFPLPRHPKLDFKSVGLDSILWDGW